MTKITKIPEKKKVTTLDKFTSSDTINKEPSIETKTPFEPSDILIFDLLGQNAHFRNIQTNSTSLSYFFPPPTTIYGLLAGIIGLQRDSYYNLFRPETTFFGLEIITPVRKDIYTVNYRVYDEPGNTQIPVEIVSPIQDSDIRYRIYFAMADNSTFQKIIYSLQNDISYYPPYLGITNFIAQTQFIDLVKAKKVQKDEIIEIQSVIRAEKFDILPNDKELILYPEYMRQYFDQKRKPGAMIKYFYIAKGNLRIKVAEENPFYYLATKDRNIIICRL